MISTRQTKLLRFTYIFSLHCEVWNPGGVGGMTSGFSLGRFGDWNTLHMDGRYKQLYGSNLSWSKAEVNCIFFKWIQNNDKCKLITKIGRQMLMKWLRSTADIPDTLDMKTMYVHHKPRYSYILIQLWKYVAFFIDNAA